MRIINNVYNSTNTVLETKIKLATVKDSLNFKHKALLLYDKLDRNSPYSKDNMNLFTVGTIINIVV